ncbi:MAG: hypothetical protein IH959_04665 [Chloroflexi bacterium]|nr:hypothetical protein [Chloroflexota bacterium]
MFPSVCSPPVTVLTSTDKDNYHNGYHADAVASFSGSAAAPHAIHFTWDGSDIHNEWKYLINRADDCNGDWEVQDLVDRTESSKTLTGLKSGLHGFQVVPLTFADVAEHAEPSSEVCIELIPPDLSGLYDMLVHWPSGGIAPPPVGDESIGLFHCIVNLEHDLTTNVIQTRQQCVTEIPAVEETPPTWEDTCEALAARVPPECVAGELSLKDPVEGPDGVSGPPPPPPYSLHPPSVSIPPTVSSGHYFPNGELSLCPGAPCSVITWCQEDVGSPGDVGPNVVWRIIIFNPGKPSTMQLDTDGDTSEDTQVKRVSTGKVDIFYNKSVTRCDSGDAAGFPTFDDLPVLFIKVHEPGGFNPNSDPAWWRTGELPRKLDFDDDNCIDERELSANPGPNCGDDPYNPTDSFFNPNTVDLSGAYDITMRVRRGDCGLLGCDDIRPGEYFSCKMSLEHDTNDNTVSARTYCYHDEAAADINPEAFPGKFGDGFWGAPPPGPLDANGNYAFGDVDETHTELTGTFDTGSREIRISGCFQSLANLGNVYVELTLDAHQKPGTVDIWTGQDNATCTTGAAFGDYDIANGAPPGPYNDADVFVAKQPGGAGRDSDRDGVPDSRELMDDTVCGRRDPYNPYDYYDVSIPRDGVIDLPNDILGVILHFAPGGYAAGDENWDRPPVMAGAGLGSTWNRGTPDGVIDLPNDQLGVIFQFNPGGCPALS